MAKSHYSSRPSPSKYEKRWLAIFSQDQLEEKKEKDTDLPPPYTGPIQKLKNSKWHIIWTIGSLLLIGFVLIMFGRGTVKGFEGEVEGSRRKPAPLPKQSKKHVDPSLPQRGGGCGGGGGGGGGGGERVKIIKNTIINNFAPLPYPCLKLNADWNKLKLLPHLPPDTPISFNQCKFHGIYKVPDCIVEIKNIPANQIEESSPKWFASINEYLQKSNYSVNLLNAIAINKANVSHPNNNCASLSTAGIPIIQQIWIQNEIEYKVKIDENMENEVTIKIGNKFEHVTQLNTNLVLSKEQTKRYLQCSKLNLKEEEFWNEKCWEFHNLEIGEENAKYTFKSQYEHCSFTILDDELMMDKEDILARLSLWHNFVLTNKPSPIHLNSEIEFNPCENAAAGLLVNGQCFCKSGHGKVGNGNDAVKDEDCNHSIQSHIPTKLTFKTINIHTNNHIVGDHETRIADVGKVMFSEHFLPLDARLKKVSGYILEESRHSISRIQPFEYPSLYYKGQPLGDTLRLSAHELNNFSAFETFEERDDLRVLGDSITRIGIRKSSIHKIELGSRIYPSNLIDVGETINKTGRGSDLEWINVPDSWVTCNGNYCVIKV